MNKEEVKTVLEFCNRDVVELLLRTVNLKEKEYLAIKNVDMLGKTKEETAEVMNCSIKSIYNYRQKAFIKIAKALKDNEIVKMILNY